MGVANVPASAGGGISSVQRGSAGASGNVTITAVNMNKTFVTVFGSASSGTVAATGALSAATGNLAAENISIRSGAYNAGVWLNGAVNTTPLSYLVSGVRAMTMNSTNLSGGTNNLVAAAVTGFLASTTVLTVSGACRYEVVEFA